MGPERERVAAYVVFDDTAGNGTCDVKLWREPSLDLLAPENGSGKRPELRVALLQIDTYRCAFGGEWVFFDDEGTYGCEVAGPPTDVAGRRRPRGPGQGRRLLCLR
jgi:hypothetical protein